MLVQSEDTGLAQPLPRKGGVQHSNSPKEKGWGYLGAQRLQSKEPCFTACPSTHGKRSSYEAVFFYPAGSWGTGECRQRSGGLLWKRARSSGVGKPGMATVKTCTPGQELPSVEWTEDPPGRQSRSHVMDIYPSPKGLDTTLSVHEISIGNI